MEYTPDVLDGIIQIEDASFPPPARWSRDDLLDELRHEHVGAKFIRAGDRIVGYCVYELCDGFVDIRSLAVHPDFRRQGIGTALVESLKEQAARPAQGNLIITVVWERNTDAAQWFARRGFISSVRRDAFLESDDDGYLMELYL